MISYEVYFKHVYNILTMFLVSFCQRNRQFKYKKNFDTHICLIKHNNNNNNKIHKKVHKKVHKFTRKFTRNESC